MWEARCSTWRICSETSFESGNITALYSLNERELFSFILGCKNCIKKSHKAYNT